MKIDNCIAMNSKIEIIGKSTLSFLVPYSNDVVVGENMTVGKESSPSSLSMRYGGYDKQYVVVKSNTSQNYDGIKGWTLVMMKLLRGFGIQ